MALAGFNTWNPTGESESILNAVMQVFEDYKDYLPLTGRQVFYRLVGAYGYPKDERAANKLYGILGRARRAGILPFTHLRDGGGQNSVPMTYVDEGAFWQKVDNDLKHFSRNRQKGQQVYIELFCEAPGMMPQLVRAAFRYSVPVYGTRGYTGLSVVGEVARRALSRNVPTTILQVGDLDPSGVGIFDTLAADVKAFTRQAVRGIITGKDESGILAQRLGVNKSAIERIAAGEAEPVQSSGTRSLVEPRHPQSQEIDMSAVATPAHQSVWRSDALDPTGERHLTVDEALVSSGLDWTVAKTPAKAEIDGRIVPIPDRFAVYRESDGYVFPGAVGKTWQPTQNREGFQIVDDLLKIAGSEHAAWIETAMPLQNGRKVIIMVRLDMGLQIAGEDYMTYLSFVNGHDGRTSVIAMTHDERYVCANGQIGALMGRGSANIVRVRHTRNAGSRIKEAVQVLGMRNKQAEELAKQGEWLVDQTMSDGDFATFMESLMPIAEDDTPAATMTGARREQVSKVYFDAPNLEPIRGTRWGALQAVLEYSDHHRNFASETTQMQAQLGLSAAPVKQSALRILMDSKLRPIKA